MECCGLTGPNDWKPIMHTDELPKSCCYAFPSDKYCTKDDSYQNGCFTTFKSTVQENNNLIMWSVIGFTLTQVCNLNILIENIINFYRLLSLYVGNE